MSDIMITCWQCLDEYANDEKHSCFNSIANRLEKYSNEKDSLTNEVRDLKQRVSNVDDYCQLQYNELMDRLEALDKAEQTGVEMLKKLANRMSQDEKKIKDLESKLEELAVKGTVAQETLRQISPIMTPESNQATEATAQPKIVHVRSVERLSGPTMNLGGVNYTPNARMFKITSMTQLVQENQKELAIPSQPRKSQSQPLTLSTKTPQFTSNNYYNTGNQPTDTLEVIVELNGKMRSMSLHKDTTAMAFRAKVRKAMGLKDTDPLNLLHVQHKAIVDDSRTLWGLNMRYVPNHVVIIPDHIKIGDQVKLQYLEKGKNVNGDYKGFFGSRRSTLT